MFYKNQTIHHPDSKRNLSMSSWVGQNTVVMAPQYDPSVVTFSDVDIRKHNDIIAQGYLFVEKRNSTHYDFVYKIPAGMYTQQGLRSGSIDIPAPECYVYGRLSIENRDGGVKANLEHASIQSERIAFLPMTNTYSYDYTRDEAGRITLPRSRFCGHSRICQGRDVLGTMIGVQPDVPAVFNAMSTALIGFLFGHGNTDLSLVTNGTGDDNWTANLISEKLRDKFGGNHYATYWLFIHYLAQTMSPANVYDKLRDFGSGRSTRDTVYDLLNYCGVNEDAFRTFIKDYQKSDRKLVD